MSEPWVDWALLGFSIFTAVVATFPALENRSPVFVAVLLLARAQGRTLPASVLKREMGKRIQGRSLIHFTQKGGYIRKKRNRYHNTLKGKCIAAIFACLQALLGDGDRNS